MPLVEFPDFLTLESVAPAGDRCLLISNDSRRGIRLRRTGEEPRDLSWFGNSIVADLSTDETRLLFYDGGLSEQTSGLWVRPTRGGDAVRIGDGETGAFSPDGRFVAASTRATRGASKLVLYPIGPGSAVTLASTTIGQWTVSFAGPDTVLFRDEREGTSSIWSVRIDGTGARSLGVTGCGHPAANRAGTEFACIVDGTFDAIRVHPLGGGPERMRIRVDSSDRLVSVAWSADGENLLGVTEKSRLLVVRAADGFQTREETLPLPEEAGTRRITSAVLNGDGTFQAYSFVRAQSGLYLCLGLR